jgi:hypothetical protein
MDSDRFSSRRLFRFIVPSGDWLALRDPKIDLTEARSDHVLALYVHAKRKRCDAVT